MAKISSGTKRTFEDYSSLANLNVPLSDGSHIALTDIVNNTVVNNLSAYYNATTDRYEIHITASSPERVFDIRNLTKKVDLIIEDYCKNETVIYYKKGQIKFIEYVDIDYLNRELLNKEDSILSLQFNAIIFNTISSFIKFDAPIETIFDDNTFGELHPLSGYIEFCPNNGYLITAKTENDVTVTTRIFNPTEAELNAAGYYKVNIINETGTDNITDNILNHYVPLSTTSDDEGVSTTSLTEEETSESNI